MRQLLLALLLLARVASQTTGACCTGPSIIQCTIKSPGLCNASNAVYAGNNTGCAACANYASCCLPSASCGIRTALDCAEASGVLRSEYDATLGFCAQGPTTFSCASTVGCCQPGGTAACQNLPVATCLSLGRTVTGSSCQAAPCVGACCRGGDCTLATPQECGAPAVYNGHFASCADHCQNTPGACCLETGACELFSESGCFIAAGQFQGLRTNCSNNTCPQPPAPAPPLPPALDSTPYLIGLGITAAALFIIVCIFLCFCFRDREPRRYVMVPK